MDKYLTCILLMALIMINCAQNQTGNKYRYDYDGMVMIDGKRVFIIGSYHLPKSENPYKELSESGFNLIHVGAIKEALDAAYSEHLYAWMSIGYVNPDNLDETRANIKNRVNQFKEHPALLCWELVDEPAFTWNSAEIRVKPEPLIQTYNLIKEADPEHLFYMNHAPVNLVSTLQQYNAATDIVACDIYPVISHGIKVTYALFPDGLQGDLLNTYISQVGEYADKMRQVAGPHRPVFMVLQGFAWEMLKEEKERDPDIVLYPSYEESRFMAYNAIIHGATGILYWGTSYTPQPSRFWSDLKRVSKELSQMQKVISSPSVNYHIEKQYHELGHSADRGVEILAKKVDRAIYLLTANADKNPIKLSMLGLQEFSRAEVFYEDRSIDIANGELVDFYKPFDVHVYQLF